MYTMSFVFHELFFFHYIKIKNYDLTLTIDNI